jgi:hypothetical protein
MSHASKGAIVATIGPLNNRVLQLSAGISKHSAHMVSWKFFSRGGIWKSLLMLRKT